MLNQLVEFGKKIRGEGESDALKQEFVAIDIVIDAEGCFKAFNVYEKRATRAESLTSKKGKARLLLDKAEEVLGPDGKKHALFMDKLNTYRAVPSLAPVLRFYEENKALGLDSAIVAFKQDVPEKTRTQNLAFLILGDLVRVHEKDDVVAEIIAKFTEGQQTKKATVKKLCSICGTADFPILDEPHGMIKEVPAGQKSGSAFVSYNESAFESYGLLGNTNSSICSACARNYVEGLNYLLGNGVMCQPEKGEPYFHYSNRKNLASDTAMVYWTRSLQPSLELELLENPTEKREDIFSLIRDAAPCSATVRDDEMALLLDSPYRGVSTTLESVNTDRFYSCILSGAAARISVRSWLETTTPAMKNNIAAWFHDTSITERNFESKESMVQFFSIRELAVACGTHRKKEQDDGVRYELDKKDPFLGSAATMLWKCALLGQMPPLTLLDRLVRRIKTEEGRVTAARVGLLRYILNKNATKMTGGRRMQPKLDEENTNVAYVAGRIFAMLDSIQSAALGKELNAPIRDRFFSFAATNPASAFGRLSKLSQNHLGKLRGEKPGLAVNLEKKIGALYCHLTGFPTTFSLEEQGQFVIGYYHQRQDNFVNSNTVQPEDITNTK